MADIPMTRMPGDEVPDGDVPGQFCWRTEAPYGDSPGGRRIIFTCPRGRGLCAVPIAPNKLPNGASWQWDGNEDAPTLTPSINCVGGCGWHGYITAGRITSC